MDKNKYQPMTLKQLEALSSGTVFAARADPRLSLVSDTVVWMITAPGTAEQISHNTSKDVISRSIDYHACDTDTVLLGTNVSLGKDTWVIRVLNPKDAWRANASTVFDVGLTEVAPGSLTSGTNWPGDSDE